MKKSLLLIIAIVFVCNSSFAQCTFFPAEAGTIYESQIFNKGGKLQGTTQFKILSAEQHGDTLNIASEVTVTGDKGYKRSFAPAKCSKVGVLVDALYLFELFPQFFFTDPKQSFTGKRYLVYPAELKVGQTIPDTLMNMKSKNKLGDIHKSTMFITGRHVTATEKVKVPAGEFDAFVIESNVGIFYMNDKGKATLAAFNGVVREWISPGKGFVKREIIKGKYRMFYEELTAIKK